MDISVDVVDVLANSSRPNSVWLRVILQKHKIFLEQLPLVIYRSKKQMWWFIYFLCIYFPLCQCCMYSCKFGQGWNRDDCSIDQTALGPSRPWFVFDCESAKTQKSNPTVCNKTPRLFAITICNCFTILCRSSSLLQLTGIEWANISSRRILESKGDAPNI